MTKEEINRAVAEKMMGWHLETDHELPSAWLDSNNKWVHYWATSPKMEYDPDYDKTVVSRVWLIAGNEIWNPAERWDHAGMVVEKFRQQGYWVHLFGRPEYWSCGMAHLKDTTKNDVLQQADTAPMAICLASLDTVKEK